MPRAQRLPLTGLSQEAVFSYLIPEAQGAVALP
jgi:hypothetical protein